MDLLDWLSCKSRYPGEEVAPFNFSSIHTLYIDDDANDDYYGRVFIQASLVQITEFQFLASLIQWIQYQTNSIRELD